MHVRCPHCQQSIDVVDDSDLRNISCSSCGNAFNLVPDETIAYDPGKRRTLGHFELLERIGVGAFGEVWKAKDSSLDRVVAVKIPRKGQLDSEEVDLFLREARSAAKLHHPSIVGVHEVGNHEGQLFIVSDLVDGITLADRLTAHRMSFREAAELCARIADALHHAHGNGVIHRDLKPGNIMLDADGLPHIMDFGLARRATGDVTMTMDGKVLGTPAYMSPEQARGESHQADCRSDVYSLGVILFELLTGELPFRGNPAMLVHQKIHDEAPSPSKLNNRVPRDLETICLKCLEKDPHKRYASSQEVADELRRVLAGEPIHARPIGPVDRCWRWCKRNPVVATLTACLAIALLLVAWQWWEAEQERQQARANEFGAMLREMAALRNARSPGFREEVGRLLHESRKFDLREADRCDLRAMAVACMGDFAGFNAEKTHKVDSPAECCDIQISVQGARVAYGWIGGDVMVLDLSSTTAERQTIPPPVASTFVFCAFDETGRYLACAYAGGIFRIYDAEKGWDRWSEVHLPLQDKWISSMHVSSDGKRLLVCEAWMQRLSTINLHEDGSTDSDVFSLRQPGAPERRPDDSYALRFAGDIVPIAAFFSPSGRLLIAQESRSELTVWDVFVKKVLRRIRMPEENWWPQITVSNDEKKLALGYGQGFEVFSLESGQSEMRVDDDWTGHVAFSSDNRTLAACNDQTGVITLWNLQRRRPIATLISETDRYGAAPMVAEFTSSGKAILSAVPACSQVWDLSARERIICQGATHGVPSLAFDPSGTVLAAGSADEKVRFWDYRTGSMIAELPDFVTGPESLMFSPNGRLLASGHHGGIVELLDVPSRTRLATLQAFPKDYVWQVCFSPNSQELIASTENGFRAWRIEEKAAHDATSAREVVLTEIPVDDVNARVSARFDPSGKLLVGGVPTNSGEYYVGVWDWSTHAELSRPTSLTLYPIRCYEFDRNSGNLYFPNFEGDVELWRLSQTRDEQAKLIRTLQPSLPGWYPRVSHREATHQRVPTSTISALSHDGKWFANAMRQSVVIWYLPDDDDRSEFILPDDVGLVWSLAWHPTRPLLAVGTSAGSISIWDVEKIQESLREYDLQLE